MLSWIQLRRKSLMNMATSLVASLVTQRIKTPERGDQRGLALMFKALGLEWEYPNYAMHTAAESELSVSFAPGQL